MTGIIIALIVIGALAFIINGQSSAMRVTRTATMNAAPAAIFAHVNDLHAWNAWSPWAKMDPNVIATFEGAPAGTGAIMRWSSKNMQVGEGSMTIVESRPADLVRLKLEFLKPMKGGNTGEFTFKPEGTQTLVSWSCHGDKNFMAKLMGLFFNCEKMVGTQFDKGLTNIKAIVERT